MSNIYYDPDKFGLEQLDLLEPSDLSYEFDMLVVWRRLEDGALFWDHDSGCSCPTPFDDTGIADLTKIEREEDIDAVASFIKNQWPPEVSYGRHVPLSERTKFIETLRTAFKAYKERA